MPFDSKTISGVIWAVGLSGSGKTSLINEMAARIKQRHKNVIVLDGDVIGQCMGDNTDHSVSNRVARFRRMQKFAGEMERQGHVVLLSTVYCTPELLVENRKLFKNYYEIFLDCDLDVLIEEDKKDLYKNCLAKRISNVVGIDIEWIPPPSPDAVVRRADGGPQHLAGLVLPKIHFIGPESGC